MRNKELLSIALKTGKWYIYKKSHDNTYDHRHDH